MIYFRLPALAALLALASVLLAPQTSWSDSAAAAAARLSNQAFDLLNSINSAATKPGNPVLAPAAALAGDAQTLSSALSRGDKTAAANAMAAVLADRRLLGAAAAAHPKMLKPGTTEALGREIDALAKQIATGAGAAAAPVSAAASEPPAPAGAGSAANAVAPAAESASEPPASAGLAETAASGGAPVIEIQSKRIEGDIVHVTGYFEGDNLKSAGIYANGRELERLKVDNVAGKEKVNFDLRERRIPGEELRVYDDAGRSAGARLVSPGAPPPRPRVTIGGFTPPAVSEAAPPSVPSEGNTTEIPSRSPSRKGIARNGGGLRGGTGLVGVQIQVIAVSPAAAIANGYQVIGQIQGGGIRRAGIYVDGRLVKPIPLGSGGAGYADFDVVFPMVGRRASIRAYGNGNNYVEASIDLNNEIPGYNHLFPPGSPFSRTPYGANPYSGGMPYGAPYPPRGSPFSNPYGGYAYPNPYPTPAPFWRRLLPF